MNKKGLVIGLLLIGIIAIAGCARDAGKGNQTGVFVSYYNDSGNATKEPTKVVIEPPKTTVATTVKPVTPPTGAVTGPISEGTPVKKYKEGDLVELQVKATDPDSDKLTITYSAPLDAKGEWQTKDGDAGQYKVIITVSDGKTETTKEVLLIIEARNKPPVIDIKSEITVKEGETVVLQPVVTDPDNDPVTVTYTGWMTSATYQTAYQDAGSYIVTIIASDGKNSVAKDVKINVLNVNRPPVIAKIESITATEGDLVKVTAEISDPDKDDLQVTYSKPFNNEGQWQTKQGDAGVYESSVLVSDGSAETVQKFKVTIVPLNRAPVIQRINEISVNEGDTVRLEPSILDPDGDTFTVSYAGWMTSPVYQTNYNDQGTHTVTITATDSKGASSSIDVKIDVIDVNRPPVVEIE